MKAVFRSCKAYMQMRKVRKMTEYRLKDGEVSGKILTSVICEGRTPVENNKVMYFNMGEDARSYITEDPETIAMIDRYLARTQNPAFYKLPENVKESD